MKERKTPMRTVLAGHFSKSVRSGAPPFSYGSRLGEVAHPPIPTLLAVMGALIVVREVQLFKQR